MEKMQEIFLDMRYQAEASLAEKDEQIAQLQSELHSACNCRVANGGSEFAFNPDAPEYVPNLVHTPLEES